jgi:hypothetical protein
MGETCGINAWNVVVGTSERRWMVKNLNSKNYGNLNFGLIRLRTWISGRLL